MSDFGHDNQPPRRFGVVVLGMHRSGTSALVRVLNLLGCDVPRTLIGANKSNISGHWESSAIARLNDRILHSAGTRWDDWLEFDPGWLASPHRPGFEAEAIATLASEFGPSPLFVLKDPRICRLAPFWLATLRAAGIAPLIIVPIRNPQEVAASLHARNGMSIGFGHLLWLRHLLDAEASTRGQLRCFVSYEQLLQNWIAVADKIQSSLHLSLPRRSTTMATEIEAFLTPAQRHHQATAEGVFADPQSSNWIRDGFAIFDAWAKGTETIDDYPTLDRIRSELNAAAPAFAELVTEGTAARAKAGALNQRLGALQVEFDNNRTAADKAAGEILAFKTALANRTRDLAKAEASAAELPRLRADLQLSVEARVATAAAFAEVKSRLARTESALVQRQLDAAKPDTGLLAAQAQLREANALVVGLEEQVRSLLAEVRQRRRTHVGLGAARRATAREIGRTAMPMFATVRWLPPGLRLRCQIALLKRSGLLDPDWYLAHYTDVAAAGYNPYRHYIEHGAREGREPNGTFARVDHSSPTT